MTAPSGPSRGLGLFGLIAAALVFAILGLVGLLTLPVAALALLDGPPHRRAVTAGLAGGISVWWLLQPGDPPEQLVRSAALMGTAAYAALTRWTPWTLIHRGLLAMAAAAAGAVTLAGLLARSWQEIRWWVETQLAFAMQLVIARVADSEAARGGGDTALLTQFEDLSRVAVPVMADLFPATVALMLLAGFALATVIYHRLGPPSRRASPGTFRDFRFSEHLGWIAVAALGTLLLTGGGTATVLAGNALLVTGLLYALRGVAVAWFAVTALGGPGVFTIVVTALATVFMLPAVATIAILLGVVDTGMDLRRRWVTPPPGDA